MFWRRRSERICDMCGDQILGETGCYKIKRKYLFNDIENEGIWYMYDNVYICSKCLEKIRKAFK